MEEEGRGKGQDARATTMATFRPRIGMVPGAIPSEFTCLCVCESFESPILQREAEGAFRNRRLKYDDKNGARVSEENKVVGERP